MFSKALNKLGKHDDVIRTPWLSICITTTVLFFQAVQFSLFFSSMWPYMQLLDPRSTETFFGLVVASFSFGQMIAGPLYGLWSTKRGSIMLPILVCQCFMLLGNLVYFSAPLLPSNQRYALLFGRLFVGIGESSMGLVQSYVSTASLEKDRARAIAVCTGGLALGLSIGPLFQLCFIPIGYPGVHLFGNLHLSMYTTPAFASAIINILCIVSVILFFDENYSAMKSQTSDEDGNAVEIPPYDRVAVAVCHISRAMQLFVFTNLETLGAPFFMAMFAMSRPETVRTMSLAHGIVGLVAFTNYLFYIVFKQSPNHRVGVFTALAAYVLFHVGTFSYPFSNDHIKTYSNEDYELYRNGTVAEEPVGCPRDLMSWCDEVQPVNFWLFMFCFSGVLAFAFSTLNVHVSALFSRILGPRKQTNQQSIYQASGSLSRLMGPIVISNLYSNWGPRAAWGLELVVIFSVITLWIVFYKRMVPLEIPVAENKDHTHVIKVRRASEVSECISLY
ncbi:unnamed protein product [Bursaphelenchus xylophilus]|uniref:(pine wood nematode) hypothetical protein n=1 Tax=Bursaphelenchus xylophilus TaxID=6326 RepID=A0A1I7S6C3_BURXY|nr:unnamed protein product [Bursaphelenchus xylophilus]CAG9128147.1 unnamed protein product [Bursaphelenchus xylophilus]